jgi:small-conductance mechanosensitive channel
MKPAAPLRDDMERFARAIVASGVALLAGLWVVTLSATASPAWLAGAALAAVGVGGLAAGIWMELDVEAPGAGE